MKKEIIRKEFLKLRIKQYSYTKCKTQLKEKLGYSVSIRTLKRWQKRFAKDDSWNLIDDSRKPKIIHSKLNEKSRRDIILLREKTGWGAKRLKKLLGSDLSHVTINQVIREKGLTRKEGNRGEGQNMCAFRESMQIHYGILTIVNLEKKEKLLPS